MTINVPKDQACPYCDRWHGRGITVDGVVLNSFDEILLMWRAEEPFQGCPALPGGYLDDDEQDFEAAAREVKEETGVVVDVNRAWLLGTFTHPSRHPEQAISIAWLFRVEGRPEAHVVDPKEVLNVQWMPRTYVPQIKLAYDHNQMIERLSALSL